MPTVKGSRKPSADEQKHGAGQPRMPSHPAQRAAAQVIDRHTLRVTLPDGLGTIRLPEPERLAFYGGIATLAAFGILEWPSSSGPWHRAPAR